MILDKMTYHFKFQIGLIGRQILIILLILNPVLRTILSILLIKKDHKVKFDHG